MVELHTLWTLHNGEYHGREQQYKNTCRLQQLEHDLNNLFQYKPSILASNKYLKNAIPIANLITLPHAKLRSGLSHGSPSYSTVDKKPTNLATQNTLSNHPPPALHHMPLLPNYSLNTSISSYLPISNI
jgi:hypothetical protein